MSKHTPTKREQVFIREIAQRSLEPVDSGVPQIYRSLHLVGDDDTKAQIEESLKAMLSPWHFALVQAIFASFTDDAILDEQAERFQ